VTKYTIGWGPLPIVDERGRLRGFLACYFRDGMSLCGRYPHHGAKPMLSRSIQAEDGPCQDCLDILKAEEDRERVRRREARNAQAREDIAYREDVETGHFNAALFRFLDAQSPRGDA
jgi:hypothetical protein